MREWLEKASPIQLPVWLHKLCPTVFVPMLQGFCFIVGISCVPNIGKSLNSWLQFIISQCVWNSAFGGLFDLFLWRIVAMEPFLLEEEHWRSGVRKSLLDCESSWDVVATMWSLSEAKTLRSPSFFWLWDTRVRVNPPVRYFVPNCLCHFFSLLWC